MTGASPVRRRLTLSALAVLFAAAFAATGNVTAASTDSSAPESVSYQYGWGWPL